MLLGLEREGQPRTYVGKRWALYLLDCQRSASLAPTEHLLLLVPYAAQGDNSPELMVFFPRGIWG